MSRWLWFILAILVGIGLGLVYGWIANPVEYVETSPDSLQADYKTDFVLMVAEAYQGDGELPLAVRRLAVLGETPPVETVYQAILFAQRIGYLDADIEKMQVLMSALQSSEFNLETSP